ncbi:sugar transferase [Candidatus Roizmanbacteria bacterium]|nr:sugar transferase [Candidatus Roizmanbacteria bacterium]
MVYTSFKKSTFYEISKRLIDIVLSILSFIFFLPIFIVTAILIKLETPGPIFADTPSRVGKNGKTFKMYKFRSMVQNAHHILREDPHYAKLYNDYKKSSYKLREDPRITRIGKFIRKYSLDELPQFLNVINGEMSIVGPRAYYPDELEDQQQKYPHTRNAVKVVLSVKPGITGFWQVSGRSEINFDKRIEMDASYVKKRSIIYDLLIILKSPWAMLSGKGV